MAGQREKQEEWNRQKFCSDDSPHVGEPSRENRPRKEARHGDDLRDGKIKSDLGGALLKSVSKIKIQERDGEARPATDQERGKRKLQDQPHAPRIHVVAPSTALLSKRPAADTREG